MSKTCFVIMPIGNQKVAGKNISKEYLRKKYDDLIKEAILKIRTDLEVTRADDLSKGGTLSTDILTRIMHSDYVIADITISNPNVYYELGLRHACKIGTILIKEKSKDTVPFDIAHLKYIEYENSPSGIKKLATELNDSFNWIDQNAEIPDNQFLELAKVIKYKFPKFDDGSNSQAFMLSRMMTQIMQKPDWQDFFKLMTSKELNEEEKGIELIKWISRYPDLSDDFWINVLSSGLIKT